MKHFFIGWDAHNGPKGAEHIDAVLLSNQRLLRRKSPLKLQNWMLDSGAFGRLLGKGHIPTHKYVRDVLRWWQCGNLKSFVCQDYPCTRDILQRTGLSVADHQRLTIHRYDRALQILREERLEDELNLMKLYLESSYDSSESDDFLSADELDQVLLDLVSEDWIQSSPYLMPVLHGQLPADYQDHLQAYGHRLNTRAWVGVGSLFGRSIRDIENILWGIKQLRPDLQLHGFAIKKRHLLSDVVRALLFSADSSAGTYRAPKSLRNDPKTAIAYRKSLEIEPSQLNLFSWQSELVDRTWWNSLKAVNE